MDISIIADSLELFQHEDNGTYLVELVGVQPGDVGGGILLDIQDNPDHRKLFFSFNETQARLLMGDERFESHCKRAKGILDQFDQDQTNQMGATEN